jgi:Transmembrane adaptor Erv26
VDLTTCWLSGRDTGLWIPNPSHRYFLRSFTIPLPAFINIEAASGLYYLSELVEEHTVIAKRLLTRLIYSIITIQVLLLLDGFPFMISLLSISSHTVYLGNMRRFPIVKLSDPLFLTSCGIYTPTSQHEEDVANT